MLSTFVKAAGYYVLGMLVASVLSEILGRMVPYMQYPDGTTPVYAAWFQSADTNWVLIILLSLLFAIIARASVEAGLGGGR